MITKAQKDIKKLRGAFQEELKKLEDYGRKPNFNILKSEAEFRELKK